jgi:hypothetical protein
VKTETERLWSAPRSANPPNPKIQQAETNPPNPSNSPIFTKFGRKHWSPELVEDLKAKWSEGLSVNEIATAMGATISAIHQARSKFELPPRKRGGRKLTTVAKKGEHKIQRVAFETSRLMEFCTKRELSNQTGHVPDDWPRVILKELIDNSLDACEEASITPVITVSVNSQEGAGTVFVVEDNGPGVPASTIAGVLDYTIRVSSREAYVSPTRGAQGNALKTILPMAYVLGDDDDREAKTLIESRSTAHTIRFRVDRIRMEPIIEHTKGPSEVQIGTRITVYWPDHLVVETEDEFDGAALAKLVSDFFCVNPHLSIKFTWNGKTIVDASATDPKWTKWLPSNPTSPHWYDAQRLERYMAAHIARRQKRGRAIFSVREFLSEFRGLSSTMKQKKILEEFGASHISLAEFFGSHTRVNTDRIIALLEAMKRETRHVPAKHIGVIGADHLRSYFQRLGVNSDTFQYRRKFKVIDGLPRVMEFAFGVYEEGLKPNSEGIKRNLITAVNWSAAIGNPFRTLGRQGEGADAYMTKLRASDDHPVMAALHYACPRVQYLDRGKSSIALDD